MLNVLFFRAINIVVGINKIGVFESIKNCKRRKKEILRRIQTR